MAAIPLYLMLAADEAGIKLEWVQGTPTWEAFPSLRHQRSVDRIARSIIAPGSDPDGCQCEVVRDVYIRFPDGSLKRPDLAIYCQEMDDTDEALEVVPEAVVEVVSAGFEKKDLQDGPPFYLSQGVKDVLVLDRRGKVHHFTGSGSRSFASPQSVTLACGCQLVV